MVLWFGILVEEFHVRGFRCSVFLERGFGVLGLGFRVFEFRIGFGFRRFEFRGRGFGFGVSRFVLSSLVFRGLGFGVSCYGWSGRRFRGSWLGVPY